MTTAAELACAGRVAAVRARIEAACIRARRDPSQVTVVAVSKTFRAPDVVAAMRAGVTDFGENYVQEGVAKAAEVAQLAAAEGLPPPSFHFVGHLQTNKVRAALGAFDILAAVDSERLLRTIAGAAERPVPVMIHVNLAAEETKHGVSASAVPSLLAMAHQLAPKVTVMGLMTIPPTSRDAEASRPYFRTLRNLAAEHGLEALSMGMSDDFEVAIEEGATHVRVGRAIFGDRS
jgi:pyridoxal phosphate enzyme (YggS family)